MCNTLQQAKNGGQIAWAVLEDAGIDCKRFFTSRNVQTGTPRARRRLLRTVNGTAVPQHLRICTLKKEAEEKYQLGLVAKPVNIVPNSYEQIRLHQARLRYNQGENYLWPKSQPPSTPRTVFWESQTPFGCLTFQSSNYARRRCAAKTHHSWGSKFTPTEIKDCFDQNTDMPLRPLPRYMYMNTIIREKFVYDKLS